MLFRQPKGTFEAELERLYEELSGTKIKVGAKKDKASSIESSLDEHGSDMGLTEKEIAARKGAASAEKAQKDKKAGEIGTITVAIEKFLNEDAVNNLKGINMLRNTLIGVDRGKLKTNVMSTTPGKYDELVTLVKERLDIRNKLEEDCTTGLDKAIKSMQDKQNKVTGDPVSVQKQKDEYSAKIKILQDLKAALARCDLNTQAGVKSAHEEALKAVTAMSKVSEKGKGEAATAVNNIVASTDAEQKQFGGRKAKAPTATAAVSESAGSSASSLPPSEEVKHERPHTPTPGGSK